MTHDSMAYIDSSEAVPLRSNLISTYYGRLVETIDHLIPDKAPVLDPDNFNPGFNLPPASDELAAFFGAGDAVWWRLGAYRANPLSLMDLMRNKATKTTKTFASLLIVARAVDFILQTGEAITIFCPSSGNKGMALRDAVDRAIACGLVTPEQLDVTILIPHKSRAKIRRNGLSEDEGLRRRNPILVYTGERADAVKDIGRSFIGTYARDLRERSGRWIWYSLDLRNYKIADAARAYFEADAQPLRSSTPRLHVHSVSSAYGLLGYSLGLEVLEKSHALEPDSRPGYLLVQHLDTPDMVLHLLFGEFDRSRMPVYALDEETGKLTQRQDPHFPHTTDSESEILDRTFYTRRPATSPAMDALIARHGGTGIVVSRHECLERYSLISDILRETDIRLPDDPADLREWSLVMAFTGVFNAIDRGLVPAGTEIVVHGSGLYSASDVDAPSQGHTVDVQSCADVIAVFDSMS